MFVCFFKPAAHLLLYSFAFGGSAFYSFLASPIAFKVLEKEQFSLLQSKVFPLFFRIQTISPIILGLISPISLAKCGVALLSSSSICGALNLFWLLPWNRSIKEKRKQIANDFKGSELEERDGPLRMEFGKAHLLSMAVNSIHVLSMFAYGIYLSRKLFRHIPK